MSEWIFIVDSSSCGATAVTSAATVSPTRITVLCPQSTVQESTAWPVSTETSEEQNTTVFTEELNTTTTTWNYSSDMTTDSVTGTLFQTDDTTSLYSEASLMTQSDFTSTAIDQFDISTDVATSWLTDTDPNTASVDETTAIIWNFDSSSLGLALFPSTRSAIGSSGGSQSTPSDQTDNALIDSK